MIIKQISEVKRLKKAIVLFNIDFLLIFFNLTSCLYIFFLHRIVCVIYLSFLNLLDEIIHIAHVTTPEGCRDVSPVWSFKFERSDISQSEFGGIDNILRLGIR